MADVKISALAAASALTGAEIVPIDQAAATKAATTAAIKTMVRRGGSATAGSWPVMGSGTVLTSPVAGAEEYDGTVRYFSPAASSRGVRLCEYFVVTPSGGYTLANSGAAQKLFNVGSSGALTLAAATYFWELLAFFQSMSTTSGNLLFDVKGGGSATVGSAMYWALGLDGVGTALAQNCDMVVGTASPSNIFSGGTSSSLQMSLRGIMRVTSAGTIIPSVTLATAIGTAVVLAGSYFRCKPVGSSTVTNVGNWS